ncbi:hypothetical protein CU633_06990 [Bacillus sp. V3-13]|uniref:hypothetical protein n=1 Tax=Bacillus sp. V3-13 TaxID=2053728 RepID=UPI000C76118C|nr:hypothetical protein [Bacillus sp. V3-13]PLR78255.1 hypothetical protein CU633_06990 [Bacillus sp. V3-13]
MDNQIREAINQLLKGELANFEFTEHMKSKVSEQITANNRISKKIQITNRGIPLLLSAAVITVFITGLYHFVLANNSGERNAKDPRDEIIGTVDKDKDQYPPDKHENDNPPQDKPIEVEPDIVEKERKEPVLQKNEQQIENKIPEKTVKEPMPENTLPDFSSMIIKLQNEMHIIYADAHHQGNDHLAKFKSYSTKQDIYQQFLDYVSFDALEKLFHNTITEKEDGLYLNASHMGFYFESGTPYETKRLNDTQYQVIQHQYSDLHGSVTLTVTFEFINKKWIIKAINQVSDVN